LFLGLVLTWPYGKATPQQASCATPELREEFAALLAQTDLLPCERT